MNLQSIFTLRIFTLAQLGGKLVNLEIREVSLAIEAVEVPRRFGLILEEPITRHLKRGIV